MDVTLFTHVRRIANLLICKIPNCTPTEIGGCVRDTLWDHMTPEVKDVDLEVFGATHQQIIDALKEHYELDFVGRKFGVLKVKDIPIDISLPRTETQVADGHKGFDVVVDPNLTPEQAAVRRDFTINTVAFDWKKYSAFGGSEIPANCYINPFNGISHIKARLLHPVSDKFEEDPLRALRAMQFIARFDLIPSYDLVRRCTRMKDAVAALPKERLQEEWNKLLLKGKWISKGLWFLVHTGLIDLYPELKALIGVPQWEKFHPEGDCWVHTLQCLDGFATTRTGNDEEDLTVGYAVLGHDLGKATTTKINPKTGNLCAHGHEEASIPLIRQFMERMFAPEQDIIKLVEKLVGSHMAPLRVKNDGGSLRMFRRLSLAVDGRIDLLKRVVISDHKGIGAGIVHQEVIDWMDQTVIACNIKPHEGPKPIVKGQHLIDHFSMKPGPEFGPILKQAFEAQLDGQITDEASGLEFVRSLLTPKAP